MNRMALRSVGISLPRLFLGGVSALADDLEALKIARPDFAEVWPDHLGIILGGNLDAGRSQPVRELLLKTDLAYTVHAPLEVNLMDLTAHDVQRDVLEANLWFANSIGADVVVDRKSTRLNSSHANISYAVF